jgi:hypothetical protein
MEHLIINAVFWYGERTRTKNQNGLIQYYNCCKGGKISIPPYRARPEPLASLAKFTRDPTSRKFIRSIRQYNCLFAFTSMGAHIDNSVNDGRAPPLFKICGQVHHRIGSLLPVDESPQYLQLYIYDTANEIQNILKCLDHSNTPIETLDPLIIEELIKMLDEHNPFAKKIQNGKRSFS